MSKRREGRETAVQFLFQLDLNDTPPAEQTDVFWPLHADEKKSSVAPKARAFAEALVAGVMAHRAEIDERIKACVLNFEIGRIAAVDRNILRVAIFELLHSPDVAPVIIINEAIEIAKKFGAEKSGGFVNGILDRIKNEIGRPAREPLRAKAAPPESKSQSAPPVDEPQSGLRVSDL